MVFVKQMYCFKKNNKYTSGFDLKNLEIRDWEFVKQVLNTKLKVI